jgi:Uma2 family endonuclease
VATETLRRAAVTWTYADLCTFPEDRYRYEILDGELVVTPSPTTTHQKISGRIHMELMLQVEHTGAGIVFYAPVDLIFAETRTVVPDLLVVATERRGIITERGVEGAPALVVEILSPSTQVTDRERKRKLYAAEGVAEYWLVDPATHSFQVLALMETGYRLHGRFGPGERVSSTVFALDLEVDPVFAP